MYFKRFHSNKNRSVYAELGWMGAIHRNAIFADVERGGSQASIGWEAGRWKLLDLRGFGLWRLFQPGRWSLSPGWGLQDGANPLSQGPLLCGSHQPAEWTVQGMVRGGLLCV